jgi:hypothetical protein
MLRRILKMADKETKEFDNVSIPQMKINVVEAARRTKRNGLTPYSIAVWEKLKFQGDEMGIGIGRINYSSGGTGGKVVVADGGNQRCAVSVIWEKIDSMIQDVTGHFWQNLEEIVKAGGFVPKPRSVKSLVSAFLLVALTIWAMIMLTGSIITLMNTPPEDSNMAFLMTMLSFCVMVLGIVSSIFAFKRSAFYLVLTFPIAILFFFGIFLPLMLGEWSFPNAFTSIIFGAAIVNIVIISLTRKEYM